MPVDDQVRFYEAKLLKGALNMVQLGFRVRELIGGLDCWRYDGYAVDGLEPVQPAGSCGCS
jgi:hypothetical protein